MFAMRYFFFVRYGFEEVELSSSFIFETNKPIICKYNQNCQKHLYKYTDFFSFLIFFVCFSSLWPKYVPFSTASD